MRKIALFIALLCMPTLYAKTQRRKPRIIESWGKIVTLNWGDISSDDAANLIGSTIVAFGIGGIVYFYLNKQPTPPKQPIIIINPEDYVDINTVPLKSQSTKLLVPKDKAEYMRISDACVRSRNGIPHHSSAWTHAVYKCLLKENSTAARRVMEDWIKSGRLNDHRKSYGIT